jgi:hypothetical protein
VSDKQITRRFTPQFLMGILGRVVMIALVGALPAFGQGARITNPSKTTINFDDLQPGVILTNQYASMGVLFSAGGDGPAGEIHTEPDYGTLFFGNSQPNFVLVGFGYLTISFVDPSTGLAAEALSVSARVGDGDPSAEGVGVTGFDQNGNVVYSAVVHLIEEGATVNIPVKVSKLRLFGIYVSPPTGFAIDDLSFVRR